MMGRYISNNMLHPSNSIFPTFAWNKQICVMGPCGPIIQERVLKCLTCQIPYYCTPHTTRGPAVPGQWFGRFYWMTSDHPSCLGMGTKLQLGGPRSVLTWFRTQTDPKQREIMTCTNYEISSYDENSDKYFLLNDKISYWKIPTSISYWKYFLLKDCLSFIGIDHTQDFYPNRFPR